MPVSIDAHSTRVKSDRYSNPPAALLNRPRRSWHTGDGLTAGGVVHAGQDTRESVGFAGTNIERTRWRSLIAAGFVALAPIGAGLTVPPLIGIGFRFAVLTILHGVLRGAAQAEVEHRPPKPLR